eukprot:6280421-Pyramimonas_sp.AAC.1
MPSSFLIWWCKYSPVRYNIVQFGSACVDWRHHLCEDERPEAYWWRKISFVQVLFRPRGHDDDGGQVEVPADMEVNPARPAPRQQQR